MKSFKTFCKEHIVKTSSGFKLVSKKTGKNLGEYPSKEGAEKRERQVQYFKHHAEETLWETADKKDRITFDIPLIIRVLELAREDIKSDMDLHRVVERLIDIRNKGVLTMDDYDFIANIKEQYVKEDADAGFTHKVIHIKTGNLIGKYTSLKAAHKAADKKDSAYGAVAHRVVPLPIKEDGMGAAAIASPGPTNVVGTGNIAGSGGKGGEPGVNLKKKKAYNPVMMGMGSRQPPKG